MAHFISTLSANNWLFVLAQRYILLVSIFAAINNQTAPSDANSKCPDQTAHPYTLIMLFCIIQLSRKRAANVLNKICMFAGLSGLRSAARTELLFLKERLWSRRQRRLSVKSSPYDKLINFGRSRFIKNTFLYAHIRGISVMSYTPLLLCPHEGN